MSVKYNPQNPDAVGGYASFLHGIHGTNGNKKLIEDLYNSAIVLDSTHVNNLCNFGLFLSEVMNAFPKAEGMYRWEAR